MKKGASLERGIAKNVNYYPPRAGFCYNTQRILKDYPAVKRHYPNLEHAND